MKTLWFLIAGLNLVFAKITSKEYASMPTLFELDDFDRCLMYGEKALYCSITFQLKPIDPDNPSKTWKIIEEVISNVNNYRHDRLRHGICIPITCPEIHPEIYNNQTELERSLTECYNKKYEHKGLTGEITKIYCETQETPYPIGVIEYIVAFVLIGYIVLVIVSSFFEGIARYQDNYEELMKKTHMKIFTIFSIPRNWYRLNNVDFSNPDIQKLKCIQGIRFYNMILVIIAHSVMITVASPLHNTTFLEKLKDNPTFIFLSNGGYAVETFFMISTWLLTWQMLSAYENKKTLKMSDLVMIFINRYVRLTPLLAVIIALQSTWLIRAYRAPLWHMFAGREYTNCRRNWWANLLYVQIYYDNKEMCMGHTWYMSTDTQIFALSLIAVYFMLKYPKKTPFIIALPLVLHVIILGYYNYINDWEFILRQTPETFYNISFVKIEQFTSQLVTVYCNLPGMGAGLFFGYIYHKYKDVNLFPTKLHVVLWWILTFGSGFGIIILPGIFYFDDNYVPNFIFSMVVGCVARIVFSFAVGYVILGFSQGIGWMALWVVEWGPTYVFGRLTYSAYIAHILVLGSRAALLSSPVHVTLPKCLADFASDIVLTYLLAVVLTIFFELPLSELQKLWLKNTKQEISDQNKKSK